MLLGRHHGQVLTSLRELAEQDAFQDVQLHLADGELRSCRPLVAALSPVLRAMLALPMLERGSGRVSLPDVSKDDWRCITSFYFSDQSLVTADNVADLIVLADKYDLGALLSHCSDVLMDTLSPDNCLDRLQVVKRLRPKEYAENIEKFVATNFSRVVPLERFAELEKPEFLALLKHPCLVATEDGVCESVLSWLMARDANAHTAAELFLEIKVHDVSMDYLCNDVIYHDHVRNNEVLRTQVTDELKRRHEFPSACGSLTVPYQRNMETVRDVVVVGYDGQGTTHCFYSHKDLDQWNTLSSSTEIGDYFAAERFGESIYITGGKKSLQKTFIFDVCKRTWTEGPRLVQGRRNHAMTSVGSSLYVLGGCSPTMALASIEELAIGQDRWTRSGDLQWATKDCGVASIDHLIIVVGGKTRATGVQTFDVRTRTSNVLHEPLPASVRFCRGARYNDASVFVTQEGNCIEVDKRGHIVCTENTHHHVIPKKKNFGVLIEATREIVIGGGGPDVLAGRSVVGYPTKGAEETLEPLPVALRVFGAFRVTLQSNPD